MIRRPKLPSSWDFRKNWKRLLHSEGQPKRTAAAFGLGALIGFTPILGVHTWMAAGLASVLKLPPLACVIGTNLSNPITFIPITILEVRLGAWLLGRPFRALPTEFSAADLGTYWLEAWVGWLLLGSLAAFLSYGITESALRRHAQRSRVPR